MVFILAQSYKNLSTQGTSPGFIYLRKSKVVQHGKALAN